MYFRTRPAISICSSSRPSLLPTFSSLSEAQSAAAVLNGISLRCMEMRWEAVAFSMTFLVATIPSALRTPSTMHTGFTARNTFFLWVTPAFFRFAGGPAYLIAIDASGSDTRLDGTAVLAGGDLCCIE
jgi:hypothetical protein